MNIPNSIKAISALALISALAANLALAGNPNPKVLPPNATPYGQTYSEWAAAWWQWAVAIPPGENPLFDETGANVAADQSGPVWFLCGVWNATGSATRTATIPAGKALFFPILNYVWISTPGDPPWDEPYTDPDTGITYPSFEAWFRVELRATMDSATDLACEVDGVPVNNLTAYREESVIFDVTVPDDNLFELPGGTYGPSLDSGYYLLLAPLSAGDHTIHFHGRLPNFTLDITYNLTVLK